MPCPPSWLGLTDVGIPINYNKKKIRNVTYSTDMAVFWHKSVFSIAIRLLSANTNVKVNQSKPSHLEHVINKHEKVTDNPPLVTYVNKTDNSVTFKNS